DQQTETRTSDALKIAYRNIPMAVCLVWFQWNDSIIDLQALFNYTLPLWMINIIFVISVNRGLITAIAFAISTYYVDVVLKGREQAAEELERIRRHEALEVERERRRHDRKKRHRRERERRQGAVLSERMRVSIDMTQSEMSFEGDSRDSRDPDTSDRERERERERGSRGVRAEPGLQSCLRSLDPIGDYDTEEEESTAEGEEGVTHTVSNTPPPGEAPKGERERERERERETHVDVEVETETEVEVDGDCSQ
ncbi:hypothetical protein KIPB_009886, partial [Kipferlia bialata]